MKNWVNGEREGVKLQWRKIREIKQKGKGKENGGSRRKKEENEEREIEKENCRKKRVENDLRGDNEDKA